MTLPYDPMDHIYDELLLSDTFHKPWHRWSDEEKTRYRAYLYRHDRLTLERSVWGTPEHQGRLRRLWTWLKTWRLR